MASHRPSRPIADSSLSQPCSTRSSVFWVPYGFGRLPTIPPPMVWWNVSTAVSRMPYARATESITTWVEALPLILLHLRSLFKPVLGSSPARAQMVYGTTFRLPGELVTFSPVFPSTPVYVQQLQRVMQELQPPPVDHHQSAVSSTGYIPHVFDKLLTFLSDTTPFGSHYAHLTTVRTQSSNARRITSPSRSMIDVK